MAFSRQELDSAALLPVCGRPPEAGWFVLPEGWELGRPVPVSRVEAAEAAWRASALADREGSPGTLGGAAVALLFLLFLLGAGAAVVVVRRARRRSGLSPTGETEAEGTPGLEAPGGDTAPGGIAQGDPTRSDDGREGSDEIAEGRTPIRTRPREPAGPAIVVPLRRPAPRPDAVPVRLPPHIAAALTRARSGPPAGPGRVGPAPGGPPPAGEEEALDTPPPPRSGRRGKSWLVDD